MTKSTGQGKPAARVQMSRAELEQFVAAGRPTGLLLKAVALLKGMSPQVLAANTGVAASIVEAMLDGQGISAVSTSTIKSIAGALGINLADMRLHPGSVHIIDYTNIPLSVVGERRTQILRAVGLLCRDSLVAELKGCVPTVRAAVGARVHAAQSDGSRVLFFSSAARPFDIGHIPSARWARGEARDSALLVENRELIEAIRERSVIESEFDELFMGPSAPTWEEVKTASRANGISKSELLNFIRSRGELISGQAQGAPAQARPQLALVKDEGATGRMKAA